MKGDTMGKYVLVYKGGGMAATEEEQQKAMEAWGAWFQGLGDSVVDMGNPFGPSTGVSAGGANGGATSSLTGYSIVSAASLDDAAGKASGCPIFASGGSLDVYEAMEM
jgi:hypothetical protein